MKVGPSLSSGRLTPQTVGRTGVEFTEVVEANRESRSKDGVAVAHDVEESTTCTCHDRTPKIPVGSG